MHSSLLLLRNPVDRCPLSPLVLPQMYRIGPPLDMYTECQTPQMQTEMGLSSTRRRASSQTAAAVGNLSLSVAISSLPPRQLTHLQLLS
jgi:hypothetical protein